MINFTDNPLERLMKQKPRQQQEKSSPALSKGHPCYDCCYLNGNYCNVCYRDLIISGKTKKVHK